MGLSLFKKNIILATLSLSAVCMETQAQSGRAADCSSIDIRDSLSPAMRAHFSKPHDQGPGGLCYAYSSSDIVGAAVGAPISPVHLALNHGNSLGPLSRAFRKLIDNPEHDKIPPGGYPSHAIRELQKKVGYGCGLGNQSSNFAQEGLARSVLINGISLDFTKTYSLNSLVRDIEKIWYKNCGSCQLSLLDGIDILFPALDKTSVYNYILSQKGRDILKVAYQLYDANCDTKYSLSRFKVKTWEVGGNPRGSIIRKIDEQLAARRPLSLLLTARSISNATKNPFALHVATIIGRQTLNNKCYYLIRGSEGATCSRYKSEFPCNPQEGTYMVTREALNEMASSVTWME